MPYLAKQVARKVKPKADLEAYLHTRVDIMNASGGRGYDHGVRTFDCPWCNDESARGWMNVEYWTAGCFNGGCAAEPRVDGGALEWVRAVEGFTTIGKTKAFLQANFPSTTFEKVPPKPPESYQDYCKFPQEMRTFHIDAAAPILEQPFTSFAKRQWNLGWQHLVSAGAGWCVQGKYAHRIIFPILMGGRPVGFQARVIYSEASWGGAGKFAKYLTSNYPEECGRPAEAMLYGLDQVRPGNEVVLVEGIADALATRHHLGLLSVAIMGLNLTQEKISLLKRARPGKVIVALDADEMDRGTAQVRDLLDWDIEASLATWTGGKDAGDGARLEPRDSPLLGVARRLRA